MAITRVVADTTALAADVNKFADYLEGTSGYEVAYMLRVLAANDFIIRLSDAAGARKLIIQDSAGVQVASIDSDGNLTAANVVSSGALIIPASTTPAQTTDASIAWDSDDDVLTVGTGAAAKKVSPYVAAGATAAVKGEIAYNTTTGQAVIHNGTSAVPISAGMYKYKTAGQSFTDTNLANVTATSGDLSFTAAASTAYLVTWTLGITATGVGSFKWQVSGPSAPTAVQIYYRYSSGSDGTTSSSGTPVTAFASNIAAGTPSSTQTGTMEIRAFILNGANSGTVALQAAQNSASGTSTIGSGHMHVDLIQVAV